MQDFACAILKVPPGVSPRTPFARGSNSFPHITTAWPVVGTHTCLTLVHLVTTLDQNFSQLILRKKLKLLPLDVIFQGKNAPNFILARTLPQTLLGELRTCCKLSNWTWKVLLLTKGKKMEKKEL